MLTSRQDGAVAPAPPTEHLDGDEPHGSRSRRPAAVAALLAAALAAWGAYAVTARASGDEAPTTADKALTSTAVKRTTLVETGSFDGTLAYADARTISVSGQGVLTWLPAVGTTIKQGQPLFSVNAAHVYLMYGSTPMYRTLSAGVSDGADVRQLERALVALGHDPDGMAVDGTWTGATTDAVNAWKDSLGWTEDGLVTRQQVTFAPGPVRVRSLTGSVGQAVAPNTAVYTATGTGRTVTVPLNTADAAIARVGDKVTIALPTASSIGGRISAVSATATAGTADGGTATGGGSGNTGTTNASGATSSTTEATVDVTVTIDDPATAGRLETAPVTVVFTQQRARNVLAVPVTALLAVQGGGFAVEVDDGGGHSHLVPVTAGLYAAGGLVEIKGSGVTAGTRVLVPSGS